MPARRYRSRPRSALARVNSTLSFFGLKHVFRTGTSCRGSSLAKDFEAGIQCYQNVTGNVDIVQPSIGNQYERCRSSRESPAFQRFRGKSPTVELGVFEYVDGDATSWAGESL